ALLDGHHQMTTRHQESAEHCRAALTKQSVREPAANETGVINQRRVRAVDTVRAVVAPTKKALDHVKDQERPHAVVGKPLPHFREEQREQAYGVAKHRLMLDGRFFCHTISSVNERS